MGATVQSLLAGVFSGLGAGTGSILGGIIINQFESKREGGSVLFIGVAGLELVALILFLISIVNSSRKR